MEDQEINWGRIVKGAAIAAGAIAAIVIFAPQAAALGETITTGITTVANSLNLSDAGAWITGKLTEFASFALSHKPALFSTAAAAGGLVALQKDLAEQKAAAYEASVDADYRKETFVMQEDMRRMQALMQMRKNALPGLGGNGMAIG